MRGPLLAICAVALAAASCSSDDSTDAGPSTTAAASTSPTGQEVYAVGRRSIELVDASRSTAADPDRDLPSQPDRTIPVLVIYPAEGDAANTELVDDAPAADGEFPLVVYSHGLGGDGPEAQEGLKEWAREGYIVAAPTYPLSSGPGGMFADYANQPADVSFVIDELLAIPTDDPLAGHVDGDAIAAAGHSMGAMTTIGLAFNSCCTDERVDAAIEMSGFRAPFPDGEFDDLGRVPFLAVHGALDETIPVAGSDTLFAEAPGPAAYLRFPDEGHSGYQKTDMVHAVVVAFLDQYLMGDDDALDAITPLIDAHPSATFEVKPGA